MGEEGGAPLSEEEVGPLVDEARARGPRPPGPPRWGRPRPRSRRGRTRGRRPGSGMISPEAAANPVLSAAPLPRLAGCRWSAIPGIFASSAAVPSVAVVHHDDLSLEPAYGRLPRPSITAAMLPASLKQG